MSKMIFINLPVADLEKSIAFYEALGFTKNPMFSDETAACMVISEDIYTMLLTEPKFKEFTPKAIADTLTTCEVLVCLSCDSRAQVDELIGKAKAAGATLYAEAKDYGFMYQHSFQDLDGHQWELVWMDPAAVQ